MARKKKAINIYELDLFDMAIAKHLVNELYKTTKEIKTDETISDKAKQYILQRFEKWNAELAEAEEVWKRAAIEELLNIAKGAEE